MYESIVEKFWTAPEYATLRCRHCGETEHVRGKLGGLRIAVHIVLTLATVGLWIPMWLLDWGREKGRWACTACGKERGALGSYAKDASFQMPHQERWHQVMAVLALGLVVLVQSLPRVEPENPPVAKAAPRPAPAPSQPATPVQPKASSAESLTAAQKELDAWDPEPDIYKKDRWGNLIKAEELLGNIQPHDLEYQESTKLRAEIARRRVDIEKVSKVEAEKLVASMRRDAAENLEEIFLKSGMDVTVKAEGKNSTILRLKYILWSRPLIYKLTHEHDILPGLWKAGFKKVIFDGHDSYWTYEAPPSN